MNESATEGNKASVSCVLNTTCGTVTGWKLDDYGDWCKHTNFELDVNAL